MFRNLNRRRARWKSWFSRYLKKTKIVNLHENVIRTIFITDEKIKCYRCRTDYNVREVSSFRAVSIGIDYADGRWCSTWRERDAIVVRRRVKRVRCGSEHLTVEGGSRGELGEFKFIFRRILLQCYIHSSLLSAKAAALVPSCKLHHHPLSYSPLPRSSPVNYMVHLATPTQGQRRGFLLFNYQKKSLPPGNKIDIWRECVIISPVTTTATTNNSLFCEKWRVFQITRDIGTVKKRCKSRTKEKTNEHNGYSCK